MAEADLRRCLGERAGHDVAVFRSAIRLYWAVAPSSLRTRCIFRMTGSRYVYARAERGLVAASRALRNAGDSAARYVVQFDQAAASFSD